MEVWMGISPLKSSKKGSDFPGSLNFSRCPDRTSAPFGRIPKPCPSLPGVTPEGGGPPPVGGTSPRTSFGGESIRRSGRVEVFCGEHWKTWKLAYLWINHHQSPTLKFCNHVENLVQDPWRCVQRMFKCCKPKKTHLKHLNNQQAKSVASLQATLIHTPSIAYSWRIELKPTSAEQISMSFHSPCPEEITCAKSASTWNPRIYCHPTAICGQKSPTLFGTTEKVEGSHLKNHRFLVPRWWFMAWYFSPRVSWRVVLPASKLPSWGRERQETWVMKPLSSPTRTWILQAYNMYFMYIYIYTSKFIHRQIT